MINDIFYKNLDYIDLHGYSMDIARVLVNDFVNDSVILRKEKIVIIHGIGEGKVKKAVYELLDKNKHVKKYWQANDNAGMSIVELILDKH